MPYIGKTPADIIATAVDTTTGAFSGAVTVTTADNNPQLILKSTDADSSTGPVLDLTRDSASPADGDSVGEIVFKADDDGGNSTEFASIQTKIADASDGAESGKIEIAMNVAGTSRKMINIKSNEVAINDGSIDVDFRVESTTKTNMLFVDAGNERIGINQGTPLQPLHLTDDDFAFARFQTTAVSRTGMDIGQHQDGRGQINLRDSDDFTISTADTERLRITSAGRLSTGAESSPDALPGGITLHGGSLSNANMITFKQSNTAHGITDLQQTDTQGTIGGLGDGGGLYLQGYSETSAAIYLVGHTTSGDTTKNTGGQAACRFQGRNKSGTTVGNLANHNIFGVYDNSANAKVLIDEDGDIFHDGSVTAYDSYDDAQLVRAFDRTMAIKDIIHSKFDKFVKYNRKHLEEAGLLGTCTPEEKEEGHRGLISLTGMQQLHNGAIWQQYEKHQNLVSAFYKLAKKTIGIEEANKLLTQEEIQLLS